MESKKRKNRENEPGEEEEEEEEEETTTSPPTIVKYSESNQCYRTLAGNHEAEKVVADLELWEEGNCECKFDWEVLEFDGISQMFKLSNWKNTTSYFLRLSVGSDRVEREYVYCENYATLLMDLNRLEPCMEKIGYVRPYNT